MGTQDKGFFRGMVEEVFNGVSKVSDLLSTCFIGLLVVIVLVLTKCNRADSVESHDRNMLKLKALDDCIKQTQKIFECREIWE